MSSYSRASGRSVSLQDLPITSIYTRASEAQTVYGILPDLPITLTGERELFISVNGKSLTISSPDGLKGMKIKPNDLVREISTADDTITISISGASSHGLSSIVIKLEPTTESRKDTVPLISALAPLQLMDQYATLRAKPSLTAAEAQQLSSLLAKIGNEFRNIEENHLRYQSSRTTPTSSGEGRGGPVSRTSG